MLDRIRYYWGHPDVESALGRLHANLSRGVPAGLMTRFWVNADPPVADGTSSVSPGAFIRRWIQEALRPYLDACR
jgi:D-tagatose-1,6-bisphosphate aldolase subunit GatZ/KbaZ